MQVSATIFSRVIRIMNRFWMLILSVNVQNFKEIKCDANKDIRLLHHK